MAETFKRAGGAISTSGTVVYTAPANAGDGAVVLSISCANINTSSVVDVTVEVLDNGGSVVSTLIKSAGIAVNTGLEVVQNKVILEAGEAIKLTASSNNDLSATIGILEITA